MVSKRLLAVLLVLMLVCTQLSACGGRTSEGGGADAGGRGSGNGSGSSSSDEASPEESSESADEETSASAENSDASSPESSESFEKGQELSEFVTNYTNAKSACMDKVTAKLEESENLGLTMGLLGFAMMDLSIAFVPMFDVVDETGVVPMLNLKNAYRKEKGGIVTFGCDYKIEEESGNNVKDDRVFWEGKLDIKDQSLSTIYYTERNGKKIDRSVIEVTKNKDGSYTSETISYKANEDGTAKTSGYFVSFEGEDLWMLAGDKEGGDPDFTYTSVFNKKNVDIKELSKDYTITTDISYIKGVIKGTTGN